MINTHDDGALPDGSETGTPSSNERRAGGISRRGLFGLVTASAGAAAIGVGGYALGVQRAQPVQTASLSEPVGSDSDGSEAPIVEFDGIHQAGIATSAQAHVVLTAYDVAPNARRADLVAVMKAWTAASRALAAGKPAGFSTGIGIGSHPAYLTVTVGVGASLVQRIGAQRPAALIDLPPFVGDQIEQAGSDGDIVVQLCADDPLILADADRILAVLAEGVLRPRWQQQGFGSTGARRDGKTGRNLMGQIDGTNNVTTSQRATSGPVWVDNAEPAWMTGGSYLVMRRIRMLLTEWDRWSVEAQESVIGRKRDTGAPFGGTRETDFVDLHARNFDGTLRIPADAHVRHAKPLNASENMMRRGYSYRGGVLPDGQVDQGLLFLSYQKDPATSFVPVQRRLATQDALSGFTVTTASGIFAMLPGTPTGSDWLGSTLFA